MKDLSRRLISPLIPAQAGIQFFLLLLFWVPALAGTSGWVFLVSAVRCRSSAYCARFDSLIDSWIAAS
jgi:hypothetical protein